MDGWLSLERDTHRRRSAISIKSNEPLVPGLWFITKLFSTSFGCDGGITSQSEPDKVILLHPRTIACVQ